MRFYTAMYQKHRTVCIAVIIVVSSLLNMLFNQIAQQLNLPIFLDSICTILVASLLGIWPGIAVGFLSNVFMDIFAGFTFSHLPFAVVNIASAVTTVFLVKKGFFDSLKGILLGVIILALVNSFLGAVVVILVFGGVTSENVDQIVRTMTVAGQSLLSAAFLARILINMVDKGISVLLVYPVFTFFNARKK